MAKVRDGLVRLALVASLLIPLWFLVAALGTKFGLLDWRVGFGQMTYGAVKPVVAGLGWAVLAMLGAALLGLVSLVLAFSVQPRRGWPMALVALAIPLAGLGYGAQVRKSTEGVPPIHDISTDLADPPGFSEAVVTARAAVPDGNGLDLTTATLPDAARFGPLAGKRVVEVHRTAYADLKPLTTDAPPIDAFQVALDAAEAQPGWIVDRHDAAAGTIEAHATSFWYGFVDDIAIRVRPLADGSGATVDVRSASRVGLSDMGANARRIRGYLATLDGKLGEAATGG